jgi:hypothetical protein
MLTYHPIHDPSHCIFRVLCLAHDIENDKIPVDLIRILDFYILFPHTLASMSLPRDLLDAKRIFKAVKPPYENLPASSRLMFELSSIQDQALKSLMAKGILEQEALSSGYISIRKTILPQIVLSLINESTFRKAEWYQALVKIISNIPLKGNGGLKDRSGLMEYRYDNV